MASNSSSSPDSGNRRKIIFILIWVGVVLGVVMFGNPKGWLESAISAVEQLGPWGPVLFVVAYILAALMLVPGSALTLAAGALFGVLHGTILVSMASTAAAALAFLISRYVARDAIAKKIRDQPAFAALDRAFGADGWKLVGLIRLSPLFPFSVLNYAFGLTGVKFHHYLIASWAAMLPATLLYVYLGSLARAGARSAGKSPWEWTLYGAGLLATVAVTVIITRTARAALRKRGVPSDKDGVSAAEVPSQ